LYNEGSCKRRGGGMEKEIRLTADLKDSGNYGLDDVGNLILIDYGMTKKLYERQ
jgi:hypothetical protein